MSSPPRQSFSKRKTKAWSKFCDALPQLTISPKARLVWLIIHEAMWEHGVQLGASQLCDSTGLSRRSVQNATKELVDAGLLTIKKKGGVFTRQDGTKVNVANLYETKMPVCAKSKKVRGSAPDALGVAQKST